MLDSEKYKLVWESRTTKFGFQSPDIFEKPGTSIIKLESIIKRVIDDYLIEFKSQPNIFIQSWPKIIKLTGWFNRLLKDGYHTSHIHSNGWLSGVVYLKLPNSDNSNEGGIEFGLHGYELPIIDPNYPRKFYQPKRGDIILFPSSLFHRTVPIKSDSERCVIAFDMVP